MYTAYYHIKNYDTNPEEGFLLAIFDQESEEFDELKNVNKY